MKTGIVEYIRSARAVGTSDVEIHASLIKAGWDTATVVAALAADITGKQNHATQEKSTSAKHGHSRRTTVLVFIVLVLLIAGAASAYIFTRGGTVASQPPFFARGDISIVATSSDAAGVDPATSFTIATARAVDEDMLRQKVLIQPAVEFTLKKTANRAALRPWFIRRVFAQADLQPLAYTYSLVPTKPLEPDTVYSIAVTDNAIALQDYSFAFQVKAGFSLVAGHPRDKAAQVPTNSGIELTFNRIGIKNPEQFIRIDSADQSIQGTFSVRRDTVVFVPKELQPFTIYTVTIRQGLVADNGDVLPKDYTIAFETSGAEANLQQRYLSFGRDMSDMLPTKKPIFSVYLNSINENAIDGSLYKVPTVDAFVDSYVKSRKWEWGWSYYYTREGRSAFQPDESARIASFKPTVITDSYQKYLELPEALPEGFYIFKVEAAGISRLAWFQVTPLDYYSSLTEEKGLVWLYDNNSRSPISDAHVMFTADDGRPETIGTTDANGLATFPTPAVLRDRTDSLAAPRFFVVEHDTAKRVIKVGDQWGYSSTIPPGDGYWDFLATDRYAYRLSDAIKFWGIIKGRGEDIKKQKVTVALYPGYYGGYFSQYGDNNSNATQSLVEQEVVVSPYDTIEGELSYEGVSPGSYSLVVLRGSTVISQKSVELLSFSKPAYQITVTPSKKAIFAGDEVAFTIKAQLFDGTPAGNLAVAYSIYWQGSTTGKVQLDKSGEATVRYTPTYIPSENYPNSISMTAFPAQSEEGDISGSTNLWVFGPHLRLHVEGETAGGDVHTIRAKVNEITLGDGSKEYGYGSTEYIGRPIAGQTIRASVVKRTYIRKEIKQEYDPIYKISYKVYDYSHRDDVIEQLTGTTNAAGEWTVTRKLPKEDMVTYSVTFEVTDAVGRIDSEVYSGSSFYAPARGAYSFGLNFSNDTNSEKAFSVGDQVNLAVTRTGSLSPNQPVLWYRYQNSLMTTNIQREAVIAEPFTQSFAPNVLYRAVTYGPVGFVETGVLAAYLQQADRTISLKISSDKPSYRPKDTVQLSLSVEDAHQQPVSAQVNVAAVDEALFHVLPYNWQENIVDGLYRRIYISPLVSWSRLDATQGLAQGAEFGGCFTTNTPVTMSDGTTKPIQKITVGDAIATFTADGDHRIQTAVVQGTSHHQVNEYLIINGSLRVTPEHPVYVNHTWSPAGSLRKGDHMLSAQGEEIAVRSIQRIAAPNTEVYNLVVGTYHTYFANGFYVHNAEKGGGSPRSNFVDVPLFKTVSTDAHGTASLSFTAPDNITSWRITALAYNTDRITAGQQTALIPVTLPLFVDLVSAPTYLTGDEPQVTARLFGTSYDASAPARIHIASTDLKLDAGQTNAESFTRLPLGKLPVGHHEITVQAEQKDLTDAIQRSFNVVDTYFRVPVVSSQIITDPNTVIKGNEHGFTTIRFVDAGRGQYFYPLLWRTYQNSIRLDETIAGLVAHQALHDYFGESEPDAIDVTTYQLDTGGMAQFVYGSTNLALSALVADAAPDSVGREALANYFHTIMSDANADQAIQLQALYGLASLHKPVLTELQHIANSRLGFDESLYVALGLAKVGDWERARSMYSSEIRPKLTFKDGAAWLGGETDATIRIKKTALVGVLAGHLHEVEDAHALWSYTNEEQPKDDLDVLEDTMILKDLIVAADPLPAQVTYQTGSKSGTVDLAHGASRTIILSRDELNNLKLSELSGKLMAVSYYETSRRPADIKQSNDLSLQRTYSVEGKQTTSFNEGDTVKVTLAPKFAKGLRSGYYQMVDFLPSGLRPFTATYERNLYTGDTSCNQTWYPSKVIDNIVYFDVGYSTDSKCADFTVNYFARVVSPGIYRANPAILQSAERTDTITLTKEDRVEIH